MCRQSRNRVASGITLVELLVVIVLVGAGLFVALPGMQHLLQSNRVQVEASRLMAAINLVRSEAVRRNVPVTMCPSAAASTGAPVCSGVYADGWIIFSDRDRNSTIDGQDQLIRVDRALPDGFTLTNRAGTRNANEKITYFPDGTSGRNRTLLVCAPQGSGAPSKSVVMNIVGRPRMASDWGTCPAG
jgi:type IV fimbrial biogenesis protein FimT